MSALARYWTLGAGSVISIVLAGACSSSSSPSGGGDAGGSEAGVDASSEGSPSDSASAGPCGATLCCTALAACCLTLPADGNGAPASSSQCDSTVNSGVQSVCGQVYARYQCAQRVE